MSDKGEKLTGGEQSEYVCTTIPIQSLHDMDWMTNHQIERVLEYKIPKVVAHKDDSSYHQLYHRCCEINLIVDGDDDDVIKEYVTKCLKLRVGTEFKRDREF
ncbi:hypothetical protein DFA_03574 [Cavenderia fasciculata]|uniref:Uncharacterized protein n=1 Tax=Cavenderia fasciculata TaxID=261658 RepID=F4PI42_CACFS|nr:uncharacterized protein DFA_03574 [Cavenderia fasciculata]EGG25325.1 hypothetical protein DFA_03574 [Cavenderia fasciculata]|eukprot:XP_004363176.1 hypothetical protein DFA_03574 [Cavenderia fasciculata]